jgi:hypothetical protein
MKIVAADNTITQLKKDAANYEAQAVKTSEPEMSKFRRLAALCEEWVAALKTGRWMS